MEGRVAGMGRPGFNRCHWSELSLEEALVLSWLGKQTEAAPAVHDLRQYLDRYAPKVTPFYKLTHQTIQDQIKLLHERPALLDVLDQLNTKTQLFQQIDWVEDGTQSRLHLTRDLTRLQDEIDLLKQHRIAVLISLTEHPMDVDHLDGQFTLYHLPIEDVSPPTHEQVYTLASLLAAAFESGENVAVHCLAGLGRTTTMLIAAHLVQGYTLPDLTTWIRRQNPHFLFAGSQAKFVYELADRLNRGDLSIIHPALR
jgi:protein-tyrosine phosphatase